MNISTTAIAVECRVWCNTLFNNMGHNHVDTTNAKSSRVRSGSYWRIIVDIVAVIAALLLIVSWIYDGYRPHERIDVVTVCDRPIGRLPEFPNVPVRLVWEERIGLESPARRIPIDNVTITGFEIRNTGRSVFQWLSADEPALQFIAQNDAEILDVDTGASPEGDDIIPGRTYVDKDWRVLSIHPNFIKPREIIYVWIVHSGEPGSIIPRGRFQGNVRYLQRLDPKYMGNLSWSFAGSFSVLFTLVWITLGTGLFYDWRKSVFNETLRRRVLRSVEVPYASSLLPGGAAFFLLHHYDLWKYAEWASVIVILQAMTTFVLTAFIFWFMYPDGKRMLFALSDPKHRFSEEPK